MRSALVFIAKNFYKFTISTAAWKEELALHDELFKQLKHHFPKALMDIKAAIEKRLAA